MTSKESTRHRWTDDEIEELRRLYPVTADAELVDRFKVSITAIRHVAHRYGIRRRETVSARNTWTPERVQYLRENVATMTYEELAERLDVSVTTVRTKATLLGVQRPHGWTDERVARLRAEVAEAGVREMARRLDLSEETVRLKMKELGLTVSRRRRWTDERVAEFCAAYPTTPNEVLAERYGLTPKSVVEVASRFGAGRKTPAST